MTEPAFFGQIRERFHHLLDEYGFQIGNETYYAEHFGSAVVDWHSDRYTLSFMLDGRCTEVIIEVGQKDQPRHDVSPIFAFLTRSLGKPALLYYFPYFTMQLSGPASSDWQLAWLASILQPMWPAIFRFVDEGGTASEEFRQFDKQTRQKWARRHFDDDYRRPASALQGRAPLQFADAAEQAFAFLADQYEFHVVHADPVFVRYQSESAYVNVFHRLKSYEVGLHFGRPEHDPVFELDFELDEFTQLDAAAVSLPVLVAKTPQKVQSALTVLAEECRTYARPALEGDTAIFERLHAQRIQAAEQLSRAWVAWVAQEGQPRAD